VAIGLALSSTSPTWRDTSFAFVLLSGLYLVLAALASYCLGGYIVRSDAAPIRSGRALRVSRRNGGDLSYDRAEAARILLTTSSHSGMDPTDRSYLARLIATDTATPAPDAERRVDEVAARVKQDISRARSSAVILAFMTGAAVLLGAIAAWAAAISAGRYRDGREPIPYLLDWSIESRSRETHSIPH